MRESRLGAGGWLCAALLGVAVGGALAAGCETLVGIPDVTLRSTEGGPDAGSPEAEPGEAGPCGRVAGDGAARQGPDMVRIDSPRGSYCIDTTEVTIGQFNAYVLATSGALVNTPAACASAQPTPPVDNVSDPRKPIDHLGECHAWSYCQWAGKRLCGMIGDGGAVTEGANPLDTEWVYACANGEQNDAYPYGPSFDAQVCNVDDVDGGPVAVTSRAGCHGTTPPFDEVYDMVGNVWEFVNELGGSDGTVAHPMGGAWDTPQADLTLGGCQYAQNFDGVVFDEEESGFRCCADP